MKKNTTGPFEFPLVGADSSGWRGRKKWNGENYDDDNDDEEDERGG